jgi:anaerobic glycerol-3-phosphate dehydrogenase
MGRTHDASAIIVSTGGILMGGLDVDSRGAVRETVLGLDVHQSEPLNALSVDQSLSALHLTGVVTDGDLRPASNGSTAYENVFVTGRTLANWNPAEESSAEGVSIATGWVAAEAAHAYLGALRDG